MANEFPKQEINIKDLPTKAVTLYPSRAHVVRDINDLVLKPGPNEIEFYGLTPTADEHSIQIDGRGSATIVDMTVELVPNREIFEEVYPEEDASDEEDNFYEYADSDDEPEEVRAIAAEIKTVQSLIKDKTEVQISATHRLDALDAYIKRVNPRDQSPEAISTTMQMYSAERASVYVSRERASDELTTLHKQLARKENEKSKAGKAERKRKKKVENEKRKEQDLLFRKRVEKRKEAARIKEERLKFWPKSVYRVVVTLETSIDTPNSSRRNSFDSVTIAQGQIPESVGKSNDKTIYSSSKDSMVSLSLSYVTHEASWSPVYDISISSVTKSATIVYRAEFANCSSETWKDAKVVLSTSQTSYQGLSDKVPHMHPWRVRIGKGYADPNSGLLSLAERNRLNNANTSIAKTLNRSELFGRDGGSMRNVKNKRLILMDQTQEWSKQTVPAYQTQAASQLPLSSRGGFGNTGGLDGFRNVEEASDGFQRSRQTPVQPGAVHSGIERVLARGEHLNSAPSAFNARGIDRCIAVGSDNGPSIEFEESNWADHGLTATYDMPGTRTLAPSSVMRRHKIASLISPHIVLSHIAVPKLRAAAFLRAKLKNPSQTVTLLRGTAGITLDGTFLGNMSLPRVAAGQTFELPLGVDPGVQVNYPKPTVRRATQGIFSKESSETFVRSIWVTNTKAIPINLLVLDQVPVSEDEKLRIEVLTPRELGREGDSVRTGWSAKEGVAGGSGSASGGTVKGGEEKWGKAVASVKKEGEVSWAVDLEKGLACLLKLEYEARLPSNERIVSA
ncbi:hypothetical protein P152DRAFT_230229 [Eremomyces bilateralis CBS 781.70]|uniref:DUF4139 domain-containing protein n=1 Tax=Eremomyces bilateralis CBS 781.70 TaxID=1392243 RepID=A0A6G1GA49_9PEZI|nr:uncharacterized protein P152DRAFT_230229 [Eremomyces bilateralis CBS 781.70]KAF1814719.1 hypothetical protein P152DRAFT_230229 [Eremomyces bilateralis CBS 781.70]